MRRGLLTLVTMSALALPGCGVGGQGTAISYSDLDPSKAAAVDFVLDGTAVAVTCRSSAGTSKQTTTIPAELAGNLAEEFAGKTLSITRVDETASEDATKVLLDDRPANLSLRQLLLVDQVRLIAAKRCN